MNLPWYRLSKSLLVFVLITCLSFVTACSDDASVNADEYDLGVSGVDEWGKPALDSTGWTEPAGKQDAINGNLGLPVSVDNSSTAVWEVKNAWQDSDTPAAKKAGIAWGADSGMTWEDKFTAWVGSLPQIDHLNYGKTFLLTTPWGDEVPAPALECAEVAMFLRITFASWYNLPFFLEGRDSNRNRLYVGHFGFRTAHGNHGNIPHFKNAYRDYSHLAEAIKNGEAEWPSDAVLAGRRIPGQADDAQPMIGDKAHAGAYFDRIFLNKRVGYFLLIQLAYFGSVNLADAANTFNVKPEATQSGDVLVHRWQSNGIGHVMMVMRTEKIGTKQVDGKTYPQMEAEIASGSMPRRQPLWESPAQSKRSFTAEYAGGGSMVTLNGGLKRFRAATNVNGRWTNVVPTQYADDFISTTNRTELAARPKIYSQILTELTGTARLEALAESVEAARAHLRQYPASCAARTRREDAFNDLYKAGEDLGLTRQQIDRQYRSFEDYVFAELIYNTSKTCCWNSSTPAMYDIVMDYNFNHMEDEETGQCRDVAVFMNRDDNGDGYQLFRQHAKELGREADWVAWSNDENCSQGDVPQDTEATHHWTPVWSVYSCEASP